MGSAPSTGPANAAMIRRLFDPANKFAASRGPLLIAETSSEELGGDALAAYCILGGQSHRSAAAREAIQTKLPPKVSVTRKNPSAKGGTADREQLSQDRSLGCMLGNVVGDALGAPLEFSDVRYGSKELVGLCQDEIWRNEDYNKFNLKPGQWTDDSAMALCLADSLLCCGGFDGLDLRQRFWLWNKFGYNNAFGRDPDRKGRSSVGLGGNISESMREWESAEDRTAHTLAGDRFTSGNGSVMRNGAVPVWFRKDINAGMDAAYQQSKTTHGGNEAAELCRLVTYVCTRLINGSGLELLENLSEFQSPLYSVTCLARAQCEEPHVENSAPICGGLENRRWNWRSADYRFCEHRAQENPGYVGSYSMDAVSMALHCVYSTKTFEAAALKAANLRGDSDSVCAVTCQIAGALYGLSAIPMSWLEQVRRWDCDDSILARALMLHNHDKIPAEMSLSDEACRTAEDLCMTAEDAPRAS